MGWLETLNRSVRMIGNFELVVESPKRPLWELELSSDVCCQNCCPVRLEYFLNAACMPIVCPARRLHPMHGLASLICLPLCFPSGQGLSTGEDKQRVDSSPRTNGGFCPGALPTSIVFSGHVCTGTWPPALWLGSDPNPPLFFFDLSGLNSILRLIRDQHVLPMA